MPEARPCWSEPSPAVELEVVASVGAVRLLLTRFGLLTSADRPDGEILALRHQLFVLQRQAPNPALTTATARCWEYAAGITVGSSSLLDGATRIAST